MGGRRSAGCDVLAGGTREKMRLTRAMSVYSPRSIWRTCPPTRGRSCATIRCSDVVVFGAASARALPLPLYPPPKLSVVCCRARFRSAVIVDSRDASCVCGILRPRATRRSSSTGIHVMRSARLSSLSSCASRVIGGEGRGLRLNDVLICAGAVDSSASASASASVSSVAAMPAQLGPARLPSVLPPLSSASQILKYSSTVTPLSSAHVLCRIASARSGSAASSSLESPVEMCAHGRVRVAVPLGRAAVSSASVPSLSLSLSVCLPFPLPFPSLSSGLDSRLASSSSVILAGSSSSHAKVLAARFTPSSPISPE